MVFQYIFDTLSIIRRLFNCTALQSVEKLSNIIIIRVKNSHAVRVYMPQFMRAQSQFLRFAINERLPAIIDFLRRTHSERPLRCRMREKEPYSAQNCKIFLDTPSESCYNKKYHYTQGKEHIKWKMKK